MLFNFIIIENLSKSIDFCIPIAIFDTTYIGRIYLVGSIRTTSTLLYLYIDSTTLYYLVLINIL